MRNVHLALVLLSALVGYRMWARGILHFLRQVVCAMLALPAHVGIQLEGACVLVKCCQFASLDSYRAVEQAAGVEVLVAALAAFGPAPDGRDITVATCQALRLLLEGSVASAIARDLQEMQLHRQAVRLQTLHAGGLEAVLRVLKHAVGPQVGAPMPPGNVVAALTVLPFLFEGDEATYARFVRADGLAVLVATMQAHTGEPAVNACVALLRSTYGTFRSLDRARGDLRLFQLLAVHEAMMQHPCVASIQIPACCVVGRSVPALCRVALPRR